MNFRLFNHLVLVLVVIAGQGYVACPISDYEIGMMAEITVSTLDMAVSAAMSVSSQDGKVLSRQINEGFLRGAFSAANFALLTSDAAYPVVPQEILNEFIELLSSPDLINPDALDTAPSRMSEWLTQERARLGDDAFFSQEYVTPAGGVVKYPRLTVAMMVSTFVQRFITTILIQWYVQKVDVTNPELFNAVKASLCNFLFNFLKQYYIPTFELFRTKYEEFGIVQYESEQLQKLSVNIDEALGACMVTACNEAGVSLESLEASPAEPSASGDVCAKPSRVIALDPRRSKQDHVAQLNNHTSDRLEHYSSVISEETLRATLIYLRERISNIEMTLLEHGTDSWDLIGPDIRTLLNNVLNPLAQVSLSDIESAVVDRNAYIDGISTTLGEDAFYGVAGHPSDIQTQIFMCSKFVSDIAGFAAMLIIKKSRESGVPLDKELLTSVATSTSTELLTFVQKFLERHCAIGNSVLSQWNNVYNAALKAHCPQFFE